MKRGIVLFILYSMFVFQVSAGIDYHLAPVSAFKQSSSSLYFQITSEKLEKSMWRQVLSLKDWSRLQKRLDDLKMAHVVLADGSKLLLLDFVEKCIKEKLGITTLDPTQVELKVIGSFLYSDNPGDLDIKMYIKDSSMGDVWLNAAYADVTVEFPTSTSMKPLPMDIWAVGNKAMRYDQKLMRIGSALGGVTLFGDIQEPLPKPYERYLLTEFLLNYSRNFEVSDPKKSLSPLLRVAQDFQYEGIEGAEQVVTRLQRFKMDKILEDELQKNLIPIFKTLSDMLFTLKNRLPENERSFLSAQMYYKEIQTFLTEAITHIEMSEQDIVSAFWELSQAAVLFYTLDPTTENVNYAREVFYFVERTFNGIRTESDAKKYIGDMQQKLFTLMHKQYVESQLTDFEKTDGIFYQAA